MGIRSDVFVGMKHEVQNKVNSATGKSGKLVRSLLAEADDYLMADDGVAYVFTDVKWYMDDEAVSALYELLRSCDDEDYIVVMACHDHPESDEGDVGSWFDNPWEARRVTSVTIEYNGR